MLPGPLRECSFELATFLADQALQALANPALRGGEKLQPLRLLAGFEWNKGATREVTGPSSRL